VFVYATPPRSNAMHTNAHVQSGSLGAHTVAPANLSALIVEAPTFPTSGLGLVQPQTLQFIIIKFALPCIPIIPFDYALAMHAPVTVVSFINSVTIVPSEFTIAMLLAPTDQITPVLCAIFVLICNPNATLQQTIVESW